MRVSRTAQARAIVQIVINLMYFHLGGIRTSIENLPDNPPHIMFPISLASGTDTLSHLCRLALTRGLPLL